MLTEQSTPLLPTRTRSTNAEGPGLKLKYTNKPTEYLWDDPNELVVRLKLLIASQEADNTMNYHEQKLERRDNK